MQNPVYLTLSRHNIFYFRFPIPPALHPQGKATDIRLSLQTRCPHEALRLARSLFTFGDIVIRNPIVHGMIYQDLRERLTEYFKDRLDLFRDRRAARGPLTEKEIQSYQNMMGDAQEAASGYFDIYGMDYQDFFAEAMSKTGVSYAPGTPEYDMFCKTYGQAFRDYCKTVLDINSRFGTFDYTDANPESRKALPKGRKKKLADTINQYMEEKQRLGAWRDKTAEGIRAQFDLLLEYLGPDASLHMSSDTANEVKAMIMALPKYARSKEDFKKLTIRELIALEDVERMSATSIAKYLQTYSSFYDWAVKRKDTDENSFKNLVEKTYNDEQVRDEFKPDQIKVMLDEVIHNRSGLIKSPYQKWGVLIALYTGARLTEIAQLELSDIKQIDGIWCFDFNDEGENKQLKNKASKRIVPIHSRLLELGILELAQQARDAGETRLLYDLPYHKKNGYGRNLSRWFGETFLPRLGMKTESLVFHSFRHTVITRLLQEGVEEAIAKKVIGHAVEGVMQKVYAKGYKTSQLQDAVERLVY